MNSIDEHRRHQRSRARSSALALLFGLLVAGGCRQQTVGKLLGPWVGSPDTASERAEREAQKYGDTESTRAENAAASDDATDWQRYDVSIELEFVDRERIEMSLAGGAEPRSGTWRILETSPTGCTIEITAEALSSADQKPVTKQTERRRFLIELDERDDVCVGFLLSEVGADRQLGALYFRRPTDPPIN